MDSVPLVVTHELRPHIRARPLGGNNPLSCTICVAHQLYWLRVYMQLLWADFLTTIPHNYYAVTCAPVASSRWFRGVHWCSEGLTLDQTNKSPIWATCRFCNCCNRSHECTWWLPDYKCRDLCYSLLMSSIHVIDFVGRTITSSEWSPVKFSLWYLTNGN